MNTANFNKYNDQVKSDAKLSHFNSAQQNSDTKAFPMTRHLNNNNEFFYVLFL